MKKLSKTLVEKNIDDENAIWLGVPKESAFYNFLMEGEFDNADKKLYREVLEMGKRIRGISWTVSGEVLTKR